MSTGTVCESLERRSLFAAAASPGFDPGYLYDSVGLRRIAGANTQVFDAVPAPGGRTYFLAERYADPNSFVFYGATGMLTLFAVTADGKLDPAFGEGGVALTGRNVQQIDFGAPGKLRLDDTGRLYFADNKRVMRFRPDGTPDLRFGKRGVVQFAPDDKPVRVDDVMPAGGGVYVASTAVRKGVEAFAVQRFDGRRVRTAFYATHELGVPDLDDDDEFSPSFARFARSAGGVVMGRLESDVVEGTDYDGLTGDPRPSIDTTSQTLVITRFGPDGRGVDVLRTEARRQYDGGVGIEAIVLSGSGKTALVHTVREVLRLNLNARTARRYDLPAEFNGDFNDNLELMPDGLLYGSETESTGSVRKPNESYTVARFLPTGQADTTFADDGVLTFDRNVALGGYSLRSIHVGDAGRLYVTAYLYDDTADYLTVRRL